MTSGTSALKVETSLQSDAPGPTALPQVSVADLFGGPLETSHTASAWDQPKPAATVPTAPSRVAHKQHATASTTTKPSVAKARSRFGQSTLSRSSASMASSARVRDAAKHRSAHLSTASVRPKSRGQILRSGVTAVRPRVVDAETKLERSRLDDFWCDIEYKASLPEIPLEPKFLKYPHSGDLVSAYDGTVLELNSHWTLHRDSIFPVPLDLMDPSTFDLTAKREAVLRKRKLEEVNSSGMDVDTDNATEIDIDDLRKAVDPLDATDELLLQVLDEIDAGKMRDGTSAIKMESDYYSETVSSSLSLERLLGIDEELQSLIMRDAGEEAVAYLMGANDMGTGMAEKSGKRHGKMSTKLSAKTRIKKEEALPSFLNLPIYGQSASLIGTDSTTATAQSSSLRPTGKRRMGARKKKDRSLGTYENAIEQSFVDIQHMRHPTKRQLKPVQYYKLFPDISLEHARYKHFQFSGKPLAQVKKLESIAKLAERRAVEEEDGDRSKAAKIAMQLAKKAMEYGIVHPTINKTKAVFAATRIKQEFEEDEEDDDFVASQFGDEHLAATTAPGVIAAGMGMYPPSDGSAFDSEDSEKEGGKSCVTGAGAAAKSAKLCASKRREQLRDWAVASGKLRKRRKKRKRDGSEEDEDDDSSSDESEDDIILGGGGRMVKSDEKESVGKKRSGGKKGKKKKYDKDAHWFSLFVPREGDASTGAHEWVSECAPTVRTQPHNEFVLVLNDLEGRLAPIHEKVKVRHRQIDTSHMTASDSRYFDKLPAILDLNPRQLRKAKTSANAPSATLTAAQSADESLSKTTDSIDVEMRPIGMAETSGNGGVVVKSQSPDLANFSDDDLF